MITTNHFHVFGRDELCRYLVFDRPTLIAKCAVSFAWIVRVCTELATIVAISSFWVQRLPSGGDSNCALVNGPNIFVPSLDWFADNSTVLLTAQATASHSFDDFVSRLSDANASYTLMSQFAAFCRQCGCLVDDQQRFCGHSSAGNTG